MRALTVDGREDLAPLCVHLWRQRVPHRVFEEQGRQVLEVTSDADAAHVRDEYAAWRAGRLPLPAVERVAAPGLRWSALRRYKVVSAVIVAGVIGYAAALPLGRGELGPLLPWLTIVPIRGTAEALQQASLHDTLTSLQWWRFVTPSFIHFGFVHVAFNAAIVIEFGRRIERGAGGATLAWLVLLIAVVSNAAQFGMVPTALFGGLSGVAYGLFAYVAARGRVDAAVDWRVNPSFTVAMLVMLALLSTGATELVGLHIANTAHWVGLALGAVAGLLGARHRER